MKPKEIALIPADIFKNSIICGDSRVFCPSLHDNSIDLIYTDPPYFKSFLWAYGWLAQLGSRVLRPGGWLLAMGGGLYGDVILGAMAQYMTYHYTLFVELTGQGGGVWRPHGQHTPVITRIKPIYVFANSKQTPRTVVYTPFSGDGNDKRFHHWGQEEKSARYYIDCFSEPGDLVLDPFVGGGTTAVVSRELGRHFIGIDSDTRAVKDARGRLADPFYLPRPVATARIEDLPLFAK